jgi:hypothetical protein
MNENLILALLQLGATFTPVLVKDIANLIHGNPKAAGETDEEYVARIGQQIDKNTQSVIDQDAAIQGGDSAQATPATPDATFIKTPTE